MKLKNPDLYTSFYLTRENKTYHVFSLRVVCSFCNVDGKIFYHLYGFSFEDDDIHLGLCFPTPEEAFTIADRICSAYPPIKSDIDSSHLEEYPEFHKEVFIDEH